MTTKTASNAAEAKAKRHSTFLGLLRDGCLRHGQPALLYLVVWTFILLRLVYQARFEPDASSYQALRLSSLGVTSEVLAAIFAWVATAANFRFLYSRGAAGLYGTLPLSRPRLFLATLGSTLVPLFGSVCVLALMLLALSGIAELTAREIGLWLLLQLLLLVTFCGISAICLQLVGRYAIGFIVYLMANFYAIVVHWGLWALAQLSIPSLVMGGSISFDWASPGWYLGGQLVLHDEAAMLSNVLMPLSTWVAISVYALVGVALMALSCLLFCHRDLERADDAFAFRAAHAVTTVLFSFGAGLGLTLLVTGGIFLGGDVPYSYSASGAAGPFMGVSLVVWTLVVLVLAETIMGRGIRAVREHVPTLVATVVVAVVAALAFTTDVTGATHYVPQPSDVESASVSSFLPLALTNEDAIESLTTFHQALIDAQDDATSQDSGEDLSSYVIYLDYHLKDGSSLQRRYFLDVQPTGADGTDAVSQAASQFMSSQAVRDQLTDTIEDALSTHANEESVSLGNGDEKDTIVSQADFPDLMAALEADVQEHGTACISSYDPDVEPSSFDFDAMISLDGPFSGSDGTGQSWSLTFYINQEVTPHTYAWVLQRYGASAFS